MFFFSCSVQILLVYSSVLFVVKFGSSFPENDFERREKRDATPVTQKVLCNHRTEPFDPVYDFKPKNFTPATTTDSPRPKRFILFPEFINFDGDWRFLQKAPIISYWIANFYPEKINRSYIEAAFINIMNDINLVLDEKITYKLATNDMEANFQMHFFDYSICPEDDTNVTAETIAQNPVGRESLQIYPADVVRKSRYRAHGGMTILSDNTTAVSMVKFNMQQLFLHSDDYVYDPIIYTCISDESNQCTIDLYYVLLHEVLHGFGIEHTINQQDSKLPNPEMKSVMYFTATRVLCHDDIRSIRMVYNASVNRTNAKHDDTCRRDFPLDFWQKLMRFLTRWIIFFAILFALISTVLFILTLLYILLRKCCRRSPKDEETAPSPAKTRNVLPRGYLYHDEML